MATRRRRGPKTPSYSEEETREALLAFNAAMSRQDQERKDARRRAKADKARKDAAEAVKRINADPNSTPEQRSAAEQDYRDAVEAWGRIDRGEPEPSPEAPADEAETDSVADEAADAGSSETQTDDAEAVEPEADGTDRPAADA